MSIRIGNIQLIMLFLKVLYWFTVVMVYLSVTTIINYCPWQCCWVIRNYCRGGWVAIVDQVVKLAKRNDLAPSKLLKEERPNDSNARWRSLGNSQSQTRVTQKRLLSPITSRTCLVCPLAGTRTIIQATLHFDPSIDQEIEHTI